MLEPEPLAPLAERTVGPIGGYYLAAYAVSAPGGFLAYAKILDKQPRDIWSGEAIDKVGSRLSPSPEIALEGVQARAEAIIVFRKLQGIF